MVGRAHAVAVLPENFQRLATGKDPRDVISRPVHRIPEREILRRRSDGHEGARHSVLVEFRIEPDVIVGIPRLHLADAANGNDDMGGRCRPERVEGVDIGHLLE